MSAAPNATLTQRALFAMRPLTGPNDTARVIVAGAGLVTPLGLDVQSTWKAMLAGESGIREITAFDAAGLGVRFAGNVPAGDAYPSAFLGRETRTRREHLAFRALDEALASAGLGAGDLEAVPIGLFTGCERENTNHFKIFSDYEAANA